jgi:hypothetical protein
MNDSLELISLAELIEQVKADLLAGARGGPGAKPVFFVDGVEVTAQVVVRRERNEGGKAGPGALDRRLEGGCGRRHQDTDR